LAGINQGTTNYLMSELVVFGVADQFPGGLDDTNVKFRAVVWVISQFFLWTAVMVNWIPRALRKDFCKIPG
jgi:hypothetical protein